MIYIKSPPMKPPTCEENALNGDTDRALAALQTAVDRGLDALNELERKKDLDPLRNGPRFHQIVADLDAEAKVSPMLEPVP